MESINSADSASGRSGDFSETLDRICDEFEVAWKNGRNPRLEEYLERVSENCRRELLAELLRVELYWRRQRGEEPRVDEYGGCIDDVKVLAEVFDDHPMTLANGWRRWGVIEGRYELRRELGRGRFGVVFLALELPLDRLVAIKFQLSDAGHEVPDHEQIAFREAHTAGQFSHPHVVQVYFSGRTSLAGLARSVPFVVFQYVDGVSLQELIRLQPPNVQQSVVITVALADALQAAHDRGFVHRDVKPANVIVERDSGRPYLTDFGLSVRIESPSQAGIIAGSPCYMSPEQAAGEGHRVNGASDQFSLGALFFELLTGRRPFQRLSDVLNISPVQLTERTRELPEALERICLKMLARERSQRFSTCGAVAEALRSWLQRRSFEDAARESATDLLQQSCERLVGPRGLGAFSSADADVYPELLPGPAGLSGLPISLEFWKQFLESEKSEVAEVGLLYGPSGCGKSSFLQAGLIPRLSTDLKVILIQCTASGTERSIVRQVAGRGASSSNMAQDVVSVLAGYAASAAPKLVLILDQFEQWLHANPVDPQSPLIRGLRHCDGVRIQSVVVVREEFWVAASRFGTALDVQFHEGRNAFMLDLLPQEHARQVLARFGRALGKISAPPTAEQREFLREAVDSLQQVGRVSPIQLSVLSGALMERSWTVESLHAIGGTCGAGIQMLRENLSVRSRLPEQRYLSQAAQLVLAALLPAPGLQIRGCRRSSHELLAVSGLRDRKMDFSRMLDLLVSRLRIVSPCAPDEGSTDLSMVGEDHQYYELTHDYVVPILREWIRENLLSTEEGRARLLLEERSGQWQSAGRPDRLLPSMTEYFRIRRRIPVGLQTNSQKMMLRRVVQRWRRQSALAACICSLLLFLGLQLKWWLAAEFREREVVGLVEGVASARLEDLGRWVDQLLTFDGDPRPLLSIALKNAVPDSQHQLNLLLTLHAMKVSDTAIRELLDHALLRLGPEKLAAFDCERLMWDRKLLDEWQAMVENRDAEPVQRLQCACLLSSDPNLSLNQVPPWLMAEVSAVLVANLSELPPGELVAARKLLAGIGTSLVPEILRAFKSAPGRTQQSANLAELLAVYAASDLNLLGEALLVADKVADSILFPVFSKHGGGAVERMREVLREPWSADGVAQAEPTDLPDSLRKRVSEAGGVARAEFLFWPCLPLEELQGLCEEFGLHGYMPQRIRSAGSGLTINAGSKPLLNVVWVRNSGRWLLDIEYDADALAAPGSVAMREGLPLNELLLPDGFAVGDRRFIAVWSEAAPGSGSCRCLPGLTAEELTAALDAMSHQSAFKTMTSLSVAVDNQGIARYSAILREVGPKSAWDLTWDGSERFDWPQMDVSGVVDGQGILRRAALWQQEPLGESLLIQGVARSKIQPHLTDFMKKGWRCSSSSLELTANDSEPQFTLLLQRPAIVESQRQWEGNRRAAAATVLLRMNSSQDLLPLISHGLEPETEAALLSRITDYGVYAGEIESLLRDKNSGDHPLLTVNQRRFLTLAVGEFGVANKAAVITADCVRRLLRDYVEDPDPGIHAAIEWSLRQLGKGAEMNSILSDLATGQTEGQRRWYLQPGADPSLPPLAMTVLAGPVDFMMGSPLREWERNGGMDGGNEVLHRRRIPHTFAIGMHEVTIAQFQAFRQSYREELAASREGDLPATSVTWYDAVAFCNWLSQQAGIPREQWCYDPDTTPGDGMKMLPDALSRTGYRLPTDAEWEYACRAGTTTSRYFGDGNTHLARYCRFADDLSDGSLLPAGSLRPNAFGLFDTLGNAAEWCQEVSYSVNTFSGVLTQPSQPEFVDNEEPWGRLIRGGSIYSTPPLLRAADRLAVRADTVLLSNGFRVARTLASDK